MNKIKSHLKAVDALNEIKCRVLDLLKKGNIGEKEVTNFIMSEFRKRKMQVPSEKPKVIVSFGKNTAEIHHFPKKNKLKNGPIMIDTFAKFKNGCFADFTWMFYKGKPDKEFMKNFKIIARARNKGFKVLKKCLHKKYMPTLLELDSVVRAYLAESCVGYAFGHRVSHSLGKKVHDGGKKEQTEKMILNKPYTMEPGIYFKGKYGIRLENDFYISKKYRLYMTKPQNKIIII